MLVAFSNKFNLVEVCMKNVVIVVLMIIILLGICCREADETSNCEPKKPFPQHTNYFEGIIKPNNKTQEELDNDVRSFYDYWKGKYLKLVENERGPNDANVYRISFGKTDPSRTVSEGQGYGMVIMVFMAGYDKDAKEIYDGLFYFVKNHPSKIDRRLMAWEVPEPEGGADSAFDGDSDIAYSLLLAHLQWGSDGDINYHEEAKTIIRAIYESMIGKKSYLPLLGDWVNENGDYYNQFTPRTSDFMLVNFKAFRKATGDEVWDRVIDNIKTVVSNIQNRYSSKTGLLPDFLQGDSLLSLHPAEPDFLESKYDGAYYYNAGRVPWRFGLFGVLEGDELVREQVRKITDWFYLKTEGEPYKIKAGYYLSGEPLPGSDYFTTFFVSPLGVALMNDKTKQEFLNKVYNSVSSKHEDYYEDTITLISLIIMSGNYWTF